MAVGPNLDEKITLKEAGRRHEAYMESHYVERSFLIKTKTFTAIKLTAYEKKGLLVPNKEGGVTRYKREDIVRVLASESSRRPGKSSHGLS